NFLLAMRRELPIAEGDRLLAVTSIASAAATLELFLPLIVGAQVIICDPSVVADPRELASRLNRTGATWMQAPSSVWEMLVGSGWGGKQDLNVLCGGNTLAPSL